MVLEWFSSDRRQRYQKILQSDPDETVRGQDLDDLPEDDDLVADKSLAPAPVAGELDQVRRNY